MNRPDKAEKLKFELEKLTNKRGTDIRKERKRKEDRKSESKKINFYLHKIKVFLPILILKYYNKLQITFQL